MSNPHKKGELVDWSGSWRETAPRLAAALGQLQAQIGNMGYNPQRSEPAGFFDLNPTCKDANHTPPYGIYVPPDKGYRHVCPGCGFSFVIKGS